MSFVTTHPEALAAAAGKLEGIGAALAAQNAAAATPTAGLVPAAADEVSVLQATQFSAYGTLYQQLSSQATAIHEMFVKTLSASANTYQDTETANAAAGTDSGLTDALGTAGANQIGNFGSAASDLLQLGSSGFLAPGALAASQQGLTDGLGALAAPVQVNIIGAASPGFAGAAPALAGLGQASSVGMLSVPPAWAGAGAATGTVPTTLTGAGWAVAAPHGAPMTAMPAGIPSAAATGRGGLGYGTPRYGVKPVVAPRPTAV